MATCSSKRAANCAYSRLVDIDSVIILSSIAVAFGACVLRGLGYSRECVESEAFVCFQLTMGVGHHHCYLPYLRSEEEQEEQDNE